MLIDLGKGGWGERKREREWYEREASIGCLLYMPWPEIKSAPLWCMGQYSNQLRPSARAHCSFDLHRSSYEGDMCNLFSHGEIFAVLCVCELLSISQFSFSMGYFCLLYFRNFLYTRDVNPFSITDDAEFFPVWNFSFPFSHSVFYHVI